MLICHVVGARPNFMKAAPVMRALSARTGVRQLLIHTGQHYDFSMSDVFFQQLQMTSPDINLEVGSGSHARQTAETMIRLEPVIETNNPDLVLVYGDVNSTVAAALVCSKLVIPLGHVEAGLRSFDRTMPEEINRLVTDQLADLLFTPSEDGNSNLAKEGIDPAKVYLVGNVMIDTLVRMLPAALDRSTFQQLEGYIAVTLHRPSNVDDLEWLTSMLAVLRELGERKPVLFPLHPRTRQRLLEAGIECQSTDRVKLLDPLPYLEFLALQAHATLVITDSGGIQEETTYLGVPCLTLRSNTERPITVTMGTNSLIGRNISRIRAESHRVLDGQAKKGRIPPLWDGHASERIAHIITQERSAALNC